MHTFFGRLNCPHYAEEEPFVLLLGDDFKPNAPFLALWKWTKAPEGQPPYGTYAGTLDLLSEGSSFSQLTATHDGDCTFRFEFDKASGRLNILLRIRDNALEAETMLHPRHGKDVNDELTPFPIFIQDITTVVGQELVEIVMAVPEYLQSGKSVYLWIPGNSQRNEQAVNLAIRTVDPAVNGYRFSFHWERGIVVGLLDQESQTLNLSETKPSYSPDSVATAHLISPFGNSSQITLCQLGLPSLAELVVVDGQDFAAPKTTIYNDMEPGETVRVKIVDAGKNVAEEFVFDIMSIFPVTGTISGLKKGYKYAAQVYEYFTKVLSAGDLINAIHPIHEDVDTALYPKDKVTRQPNRSGQIIIRNHVYIERFHVDNGKNITIEVYENQQAGDGEISLNKLINENKFEEMGYKKNEVRLAKPFPSRAILLERMLPTKPSMDPTKWTDRDITGAVFAIAPRKDYFLPQQKFFPQVFSDNSSDGMTVASYDERFTSFLLLPQRYHDDFMRIRDAGSSNLKLLDLPNRQIYSKVGPDGNEYYGERLTTAPYDLMGCIDSDIEENGAPFAYQTGKDAIWRLNSRPLDNNETKYQYNIRCPFSSDWESYIIIRQWVSIPSPNP